MKDRCVAAQGIECLAWIFTGEIDEDRRRDRHSFEVHVVVNSPLIVIVEALAVRLEITMVASLEISHLRICSDSSTLIIAINKEAQNKEIIDIVSDIQQISYVFQTVCFNFIYRAMNMQVDFLAKTTLRDFPSDVSLSLKTQANLPCQTLHLPVLKAQNVVALVLLVTDILSKSSTSMLPFHISLLSSVSKRIVLSLPLIKIQSVIPLAIMSPTMLSVGFTLSCMFVPSVLGLLGNVSRNKYYTLFGLLGNVSRNKYYTLSGVFIRGRHFEFDPTVINQMFLTPHVERSFEWESVELTHTPSCFQPDENVQGGAPSLL
ncbi:hypothetical protein F2Q68_00026610 [Brassica cretica]|uniref:RNase H type-1 domain-containing protein n=1 Tax=Brassica cretica TaxID=69181 RepID=A0A8S9I7P9_BRACR|nr:hypothetical protein F2Q68_00026610 [Brassica cretica]